MGNYCISVGRKLKIIDNLKPLEKIKKFNKLLKFDHIFTIKNKVY